MKPRSGLIGGCIALAAWLIGLALSTKAALLGWLFAVLAFAWIPIGCLALLMMTVLVPGSWRKLYGGPLLVGSALIPVAALAMVPLLLGVGALYDWADPSVSARLATFKSEWLSMPFFIARQVIYWAVFVAIWAALMLCPGIRTRLSALGLIAFALLASWMGIDLAESLTPDFHSSIYGLLILSEEWLGGIAFALAIGLRSWRGPAPTAASGAFLVALLMWLYLHAMQFLVIWSGDLPDEVGWYLVRGTGGWAWVTALIFLGQGLGPFFALLVPAVRASRTAMSAIAALTLAMRPVEAAWLLVPGQQSVWPALLLGAVAIVAIAGLGWAALDTIERKRPRWFDPEPFFVDSGD